jgi:hypothetical protein
VPKELDTDTGTGDRGTPDLQIIAGGKGAGESSPGRIEHRGGDTTGGRLSAKQEGFVKSIVVDGCDNVTAYERNYSTKNMSRKTMYEEGCRLFANPKVAAKIAELKRRVDTATVHSAASLRLHIEKGLFDLTEKADTDQARLRAYELLGKSEKVGFFLDRATDVPAETLTEEEIREQLEVKLKAAFGEPA